MARIYHLFSAPSFNQASSCSGGGAARAAQISGWGNCSAKGCFGLVHQTLTPQGWHSLLTADKGWEQDTALIGWINGWTVPEQAPIPVTLEVFSWWWKWICVCCPTKQRAFLQLKLDILLIC